MSDLAGAQERLPKSGMSDQQPTQTSEEESKVEVGNNAEAKETETFRLSWDVGGVFFALLVLSLMSSIDATIVTTSLPTIAREIGGGAEYIWVINGFLFASTATQPLFAQVSNIFGRRNPILFALFLFALGSGIAGGARNPATLISGRTLQGLGTSGLYVLADIILCDIVPPRWRGPYLSSVLSMAAVGSTVGPIIGGALAERNWRWVFWLNLPVSALGLAIILLCLRVRYPPIPNWKNAIAAVDFVGNGIFIPSIIAILLGLVMGGSKFPWSSWHIVVPLVLGFLGWVAFHVYESSPRFCKQPTMPARLFKHRTSAISYVLIFTGSIVITATNYFLPVYFQAVKGVSPLDSGVYYLPFALAIIPFGGMGAAFISKTGQYIPLHGIGFALSAIGTGLFSILDEDSSPGAWIGFQIIASGGSGLVFTSTLISTLAPLPEEDVAIATGTYSFIRSFGFVWGLTIASVAFNSQIDRYLGIVDDEVVRSLMANGRAYAFATRGTFDALTAITRSQVTEVYVKALRMIWIIVAAFSCFGFFCIFAEKHVKLRKEKGNEFGLGEKKPKPVECEDGKIQ
ncbi:MFS general substrate transporter [Glarea lozoyensis ATCC 20868]|uniref:MFS general substrate transporter n=1 Tax=Glarea lozoyensis (strain ATCC 20868 / MF5171) TaxID=1116229 RepID=S3DHN9_GLAL2|nr:MFS general substrate transporter [Glarea lozoyensis ATCC 20868]EPE26098.1 MFS general substrate transporter [Glarea lozoyensis ATCC 20868]